jgi:hypothetical protein
MCAIFHSLISMLLSGCSIVYFWFHVEWPCQYLRLASIQSLVLYPALSAYFDIIKNERHGVHVTQLCQDADDDWLSLASNICFMTQHDRLLLAFFLSHSSSREDSMAPSRCWRNRNVQCHSSASTLCFEVMYSTMCSAVALLGPSCLYVLLSSQLLSCERLSALLLTESAKLCMISMPSVIPTRLPCELVRWEPLQSFKYIKHYSNSKYCSNMETARHIL